MEQRIEDEDDLVDSVDYNVGLENINVMKSISGGNLRGDFTYDTKLMAQFESQERKDYIYKVLKRRIVAQTSIHGEPTPEKISLAITRIKEAVSSSGEKIFNRNIRIKSTDIGFHLWSCKGGFNPRGEPAMAVYEMQYGNKLTTVFLELE